MLRAQELVEAVSDLVQPGAERAIHPRRGVLASMLQCDFAAEQLLAAADHTLRVGQTFCRQHAVAAPTHMHGIHVAVLEAESGGAGGQKQGCVEIRAPGH